MVNSLTQLKYKKALIKSLIDASHEIDESTEAGKQHRDAIIVTAEKHIGDCDAILAKRDVWFKQIDKLSNDFTTALKENASADKISRIISGMIDYYPEVTDDDVAVILEKMIKTANSN